MAGHPLGRPCKRKILKEALSSVFAVVGLLLCILASSQPAVSQPLTNEMTDEPAQWKQSIERPRRDWDYDGKRILGHVGYDIYLWDATTGNLLQRMKGHKERIHAVQFSPDGHHALSSSWMPPGPGSIRSRDTRVVLWNLGTGRPRDAFQGQVAGEFSPDGRRIVTFSQRPGELEAPWGESTIPSTGEVWQRGPSARFDAATVWETFTGRQLVKAKLDEYSDPDDDTLHFSPDGRRVAFLENGKFLIYNGSGGVLYDTSDGRELGRVATDQVRHGGHRYTSNGALATFDWDRARLIDLESGRVVRSVPHDLKRTWGSMWTHDGSKVVAIPRGENAIKILDIESGEMTTGAKSGRNPYRAVISPDNSRLAIGWGGANDVEPELGIYDLNTGEAIARIKRAGVLGFSPDSMTLLGGGSEDSSYNSKTERETLVAKFSIYDATDGKRIRTLNLLGEVSSHRSNE